MRSPQGWAESVESNPVLPKGTEERVSGYGLMAQPFSSGHVLGLRRWTANSVSDPFTSIWHRDPSGVWQFYETSQPSFACSRWFGSGTAGSTVSPIELTWESPTRLRIVAPGLVDWRVRLGSSPMTRAMNAMSSAMPMSAWNSRRVLSVMGKMASRGLGSGQLGLTGVTSNGQRFKANPYRIWRVVEAEATIRGEDAGSPAPLEEQERLGDFWLPQKGIFAMGRVYMAPPALS
jgi:hypothetical protein